MSSTFITNKEWIYHHYLLRVDLEQKQLSFISPLEVVRSVICSSALTRKNRFIDSSAVKMYRLIESLVQQTPQFGLTNSFISMRATTTKSRLRIPVLFLYNYLYETGRFTLMPISAVGQQANFTVRDYAYLSNFLGITYDYFGWRFPLRLTLNFERLLTDNQFKFFFHLLVRTI